MTAQPESPSAHHDHDHDHDHAHDGHHHAHGGRHHHHHGHGHAHGPVDTGDWRYAVGLAVNLAFVVCEFAAGLIADSTALLADAGHNLSDVLGLAMAGGAAWLARRGAHGARGARRGRAGRGARGAARGARGGGRGGSHVWPSAARVDTRPRLEPLKPEA